MSRMSMLLGLPLLALALAAEEAPDKKADAEKPTVFFNLTADGETEAAKVNMAFVFAGFCLDEGREVVVFFNVTAVKVASKKLGSEVKFKEHPPLKQRLAELIERGAKVHVCPVCMKDFGVEKEDLVDGAVVTSKPALFKHIHQGTNVFSY